ncbi:MAG: DUF3341 domain-containing protein [Cytophagales bacterium]|nr:DUF3341 domain-containing protein [Cytophagales bacterium]
MSCPKGEYCVALFERDEILLKALQEVKKEGIRIHDVFSPYPVHGIDELLDIKRSRLPVVAFLFGILGLALALFMQIGMMTFDWPMIIGGKDFLPWPAFIPVSFELTVLLSAMGMVSVFFIISDLKPWARPTLFDKRSTDDKHVLVIQLSEQKHSREDIQGLLKNNGAEEINHQIL